MTDYLPSVSRPGPDEVGCLVSAISHDLRAPLRHISGFAAELVTELGDEVSEPVAENVDRVLSAIEVLNRRFDALVAFGLVTRPGQDRVMCDAADLVAGVIDRLEPDLQARGATVDVGWLPTVTADPAQLTYIVAELLTNTLRFGGDGVVISVSGEESEGHGVIVVSDDGLGTRTGNVDVFELFRRCHGSTFPGSGIGLAAVRRIATLHGGFVDFCSSPGSGATVRISLPIAGTEESVA